MGNGADQAGPAPEPTPADGVIASHNKELIGT